MAEVITAAQRDQLRRFAPDHLRVIDAMQRPARRDRKSKAKAESLPPEFTIDLDNLTDRLTVGDLEDIERVTGRSAIQLMASIGSSVTGMAAVIWVLRRKDDPKVSYDDIRALSMTQLMAAMPKDDDEEGEPDPLGPSGSPNA